MKPNQEILTRYTVKCALRPNKPRSTLRSLIYTLCGVTLAFVLVAISIVVVRRVQKQSVSNAFQYVVLHPVAPHISMRLIAMWQMQL